MLSDLCARALLVTSQPEPAWSQPGASLEPAAASLEPAAASLEPAWNQPGASLQPACCWLQPAWNRLQPAWNWLQPAWIQHGTHLELGSDITFIRRPESDRLVPVAENGVRLACDAESWSGAMLSTGLAARPALNPLTGKLDP